MNAVILAGGQGTRLWPMSRRSKPKQFFSILSDLPMVVEVFERLQKEFTLDQIYFATLEPFVPLILELIPQLSKEQILVEPSKRDSGPAMALAAKKLTELGKGDEPMVFIPTDHYIADIDRFLSLLKFGGELVSKTGKMVDIAVEPEFASTNLGYTQIGNRIDVKDGMEVYEFLGHKEKPDYETAREYLQSEKYLWHANYYMWTPTSLLDAYQKHAPEILEGLDSYDTVPALSIDYAVTEKIDPKQVLIIKGDFGWSDIGAWDVLYDRMRQKHSDEKMNVSKGEVVTLDTSSSLIYAQSGKLIATIGMDGYVVVDTQDALLICPKGRAQDVKKLINHMEEKGLSDYL